MKKSVEIFQALDFLFCEPDKREYEDLLDDNGVCYGRRITNMITICNQHTFVPAIQCPNREYVKLVFGVYPIYVFLLKPVGRIKNIKELGT